ncbi:MAG: hypothetical protein JW827_04840, partial [Spirochaetes bacterium]|nr:hypothetical protein [Spirochaetota bacterium]
TNICKFINDMYAPHTGPGDMSEYYNFIWEDGSINTEGHTSKRAFGSYAARAVWAFGYALKVFISAGGHFSNYAVNSSPKDRVDRFKDRAGNWTLGSHTVHGYNFSGIVFDNSHNAGTAVMGACAKVEAYGVGNDTDLDSIIINKICDPMVSQQFGDLNTYPFKGIITKIDNITWFQGYGAYNVAALAYAAGIFNNATWLQAAKDAVDNFYTLYLTSIYPGNEGRNPAILRFPQIAFAISPFVEGCYRVYKASQVMGEPSTEYLKYAKYAGLFASFFNGNNIYGIPTYDPNTGICFDGIESFENPVDNRINRNSGGESTVETLNALLLVLPDTNCQSYAYAKEEKRHSCTILEAEEADDIINGTIVNSEWFGDFVTGQMVSKSKYVKLSPGGKIKINFFIENNYSELSDNYLVYLGYGMKTSSEIITIKVDDVTVNFDTGPMSVPEGPNDGNLLWYAKLTNQAQPAVFCLPPGQHTLEISAGSQELILDQIGVQPVVQRKSFKLQTGEIITVDRPFLTNMNPVGTPAGLEILTLPYGNTLQIGWKAQSGVYGYNIYRKAFTETNFSKINLKPVTRDYYVDNGLVPDLKYYYKITAISNHTWNESSFSSEISGTPCEPRTIKMDITQTEHDWAVSKQGIYFESTLYNGFAETRSYEIDMDRYPDIIITINNPSDTYWSFNVLRWLSEGAQFYTFEEVPLQDQTRDTGKFSYNLKSLFSWSGNQNLKLRFYLSKNNLSTFVKEIKICNIKTGEIFATITSPQLWFSYDGVSPDYYEPSLYLNVDDLGKQINLSGTVGLDNLELILYKTVCADFDHYKSIDFKIDTPNEWALFAEVNGEEITISPYLKKSGSFFYELNNASGSRISGLEDILFKFKIRTPGNVSFQVEQLKLTSSSVPVFYDYEGVRGLPNPFTPQAADPIYNKVTFYFDQAYGEEGKVKIFAVDGKLVKEIQDAISGKVYWDGKDKDGKTVKSGLYIFQIFTKGKQVQTGTVVVIK